MATKPRYLRAAQRGVDRVPLYGERAHYPFVQLMRACDQAGLVNAHGLAFAQFDRAEQPERADLEWYVRQLVQSASLELQSEVWHWKTLTRLLAGDARSLPVLPVLPT